MYMFLFRCFLFLNDTKIRVINKKFRENNKDPFQGDKLWFYLLVME